MLEWIEDKMKNWLEGVVLVDEIETHLHLELQTMSVFSENQIPENLTLQKLSA